MNILIKTDDREYEITLDVTKRTVFITDNQDYAGAEPRADLEKLIGEIILGQYDNGCGSYKFTIEIEGTN